MDEVEITPRCASGENIFVSNEGWLLPCCYAHTFLRRTLAAPERYGLDDLWFARRYDRFDLKRRPLAEVLADSCWDELRRSWGDGTAPAICYRICGVPKDMGFKDPADVKKRDRTFIKLPRRIGETPVRQEDDAGATT